MNRLTKRLARTDRYEAEGVLAAQDGKTRQDCPYQDQKSDAWNFWVYGNENERGAIIHNHMRKKGIPMLYMTTCALTSEAETALHDYREKFQVAEKEVAKERGWK